MRASAVSTSIDRCPYPIYPICWFGVSRIDKPGDGDSTSLRSLRSTDTINDGNFTRDAATGLMGEEVGDVLAARQIAPAVPAGGERP